MDRSHDGKVIEGKVVVWLGGPSAHVADAKAALKKQRDEGPATSELSLRPPPKPAPQESARKAPGASSSVPAPPRGDRKQEARLATAKATAASLKAAAKDGVPFCADCEAARKKMLAGVE